MQSRFFDVHSNDSLTQLEIIENIKFTAREIDILACILHGRASKKISHFLGIAPKTIETHIRNIMTKLDCNARESIIDFIEKSGKGPLLTQHYQRLLMQFEFEKALPKLAPMVKQQNLSILLLCNHSEKDTSLFITALTKYLNMAGIEVELETMEGKENYSIQGKFDHIFPIVQDVKDYLIYKSVLLPYLTQNTYILLAQDLLNPEDTLPYIAFQDLDTFYLRVLEILKRVVPLAQLEEITHEFEERHKGITPQQPASQPMMETQTHLPPKKVSLHFLKKYKLAIIGALIFSGILTWTIFYHPQKQHIFSPVHNIRSELLIPAKLLRRPHFIEEIDRKLKMQQGIQTVALVGIVGMGGVGKTTLARQFARLENTSIVWEINAETKDSLLDSFKNLAYALAKTQDQKDEVDFIQKVQNLEEREQQLLSFVKRQLQKGSNWLLIYDNVEDFSEIKKYFPHDPQAWGTGKVIITTRDSNLKNNSFIEHRNIIEIGELTPEEALVLLSKILYGCKPNKLSKPQLDKASAFLKHIPPFPLDVSVAAYYINDTHIAYEEYLERIHQNSKDFHAVQETLLKETTDYTKTRYGIITLSFKKLIEVNPEYKDLLLLICLLDSQHIPKQLLEIYKNPSIVEQFMRALKKYSLITTELSIDNAEQLSTISLHRSTQSLGRNFLLSLTSQEKQKELISKIISSIRTFQVTFMYGSFSQRNSTKLITLLPHLEALLRNLHSMAMPLSIKEKYEKELLLIIGYGHLNDAKNYMKAEQYLNQIYQADVKAPFLPISTRAALLKDLGEIYAMLQIPHKAIAYSQESIKLLEKLPNTHITIIENLKNIGVAYAHTNDFAKAQQFLNTALAKIPTPQTDLQKELQAELYSLLAWAYSAMYLNKPQAQEAINYALKALAIFNATKVFHESSPPPSHKISCMVASIRTNLGYIYSRLGKYKEAMEYGFKETQYILDNALDNCNHAFTKIRQSLGIGEVMLREGDLRSAHTYLTEAILKSETLIGAHNLYIPLPARTFRAETNVRLKNFKEAIADCNIVFKISSTSHTNYTNLIYTTCFYHAAVAEYYMGDYKKSIAHFSQFFGKMKTFCKVFLEPKTYKELEAKNVFASPTYREKQATTDVKKCLDNSLEIFSAIYGSSNTFIRDYVKPNAISSKKSWF